MGDSKRDWLDVVAPIRKGAIREAAGGLIFFAVVCFVLGPIMLLTQPFWKLSWRLPIPLGILAIVAMLIGVYFVLLAVNLLRRTPGSRGAERVRRSRR